MKTITLKLLAAGAACLAASGAQAHDNASIWNAAHYPADVTVRYAACKTDTFTVPAATPAGPGRASASTNRGACLITTVSATLKGRNYKIADYTSSGTSYSRFVIRYMSGENYKIYSDAELQNIFDREAKNPNSPEGDFAAPRNPLNAPLGSKAQVTIAECRAGNVKLDAEIDALYIKAKQAGKITPVEAKRYQQMEEAISARRKKLAGDGFTLADCNTMTQEYEKEKAEVIKMGQ